MTWTSNPGAYGATDPLFLLLAALALEAYLGGPWIGERRYLQPRRPVVNLVTELERRLNRPDRSGLDLLLRGAVFATGLSLAACALGWSVEWALLHYPFAWVFEVFLLALIVAQRTPCVQAAAVSSALAGGSMIAAQEALRPLVPGRVASDILDRLDRRGIVAATIDGLVRAFALQVVAPVFWFALLGLSGVFLQQAVRTAAAYLSARALRSTAGDRVAVPAPVALGQAEFAMTALRLDTALCFLPMLVAAILLIAAAAFIPGCSPRGAMARAWASRGNVTATMGGVLVLEPEVADMTSAAPEFQITRNHIERAVAVVAVGCLINGGLVAALAWARALL
jgi:adenosylcobinamide-phosphate synthase